MIDRYLTFKDLVQRGLFTNRTTLQRAIERYGFPPPLHLSPNRAVWPEEEINAWIDVKRQQRAAPATAALTA